MTFKEDLEFGELYQRKFVKIIKATDYKIMEGLFKDYDIVVNKYSPIFEEVLTHYYEIKADKNAYKFDSFFIEFQCNGKPSGIAVTKADYYGYFIIYKYARPDLYIIPVSEIKKIIENEKYNCIRKGGDNGTSKGYIIDFAVFSKYKFERD